jgi:hypothetical protein
MASSNPSSPSMICSVSFRTTLQKTILVYGDRSRFAYVVSLMPFFPCNYSDVRDENVSLVLLLEGFSLQIIKQKCWTHSVNSII